MQSRPNIELYCMSDSNPGAIPVSYLPVRPDPQSIVTPICLAVPLPDHFATPKFKIGQTVVWAQVPTRGFGRIIGLVYACSVSVTAVGYHYAIALDPDSPSRRDCAADWAFEDDLEPVATQVELVWQG